MSGGKTKIGTTDYSIIVGKTKIGTDNYSIYRGKTHIGTSNYTIRLLPQDVYHLFKNSEIWDVYGVNSSTLTSCGLQVNQTGMPTLLYSFSFFNGALGIDKLSVSGSTVTKTRIAGGTAAGIRLVATTAYCSTSAGNTSRTAYGQSLALVTFKGYKESESDAILQAATMTRAAGRNNATAATLGPATSGLVGKVVAVSLGADIAFVYYSSATSKTVLSYFYNVSNPSLLYIKSDGNSYISTNGTSATSIYGGSIMTIS